MIPSIKKSHCHGERPLFSFVKCLPIAYAINPLNAPDNVAVENIIAIYVSIVLDKVGLLTSSKSNFTTSIP